MLAAFALLALVAQTETETEPVTWADLRLVLSSNDAERAGALERLAAARDLSAMPGLNDILYYHYTRRDRDSAAEIAAVMEAITGETVEPNDRRGWAEWVGRHQEIEPIEDYLLFKRFVFQRYDRAFRGYLNPRHAFRIRVEEVEWGGVTKDGIPALDRPGFVSAADNVYAVDDDRVFGVVLGGEAKAYPHRILDAHEMVNDVVGGRHVSISYCTLCGSGVLYDGEHPSRKGEAPFTFGSSGLLYRSNKLMYDRPTNSLWNNLTGEPVAGPLAESGIVLEKLPLVVSTWKAWRERHPDTLVLDPKATGLDRDYSESPYASYFASDETMFPVWLRDDSLGTKEWVFGLVIRGRPKAYPIEVLKDERVTHDTLGDEPLVLVTDRDSGAVRAYRRSRPDQRFRQGTERDTLIEENTERGFRVGEDGLHASDGETLARLAGHNAFWFGWYAFFPTTAVYEP